MFAALPPFVEAELKAVEEEIQRALYSRVPLVRTVAEHLIGAGGKRLRPLVLVLCARAAGYDGRLHYTLATVLEFIHTATLLHDDVVDMSDTRRGKPSANAVYGNAASVLVGDFVYSRAFELMVKAGHFEALQILALATNRVAEGEVMQLAESKRFDLDEERYFEIINAKTATLFEAAAEIGATLAQSPEALRKTFTAYGKALGLTFQLVDDLLDYEGDVAQLGKNVGDDLAEGKITLPLLYAMREGDAKTRSLVEKALESGDRQMLLPVVNAVRACGALDYTRQKAKVYADEAKAQAMTLPDSQFRPILLQLADFALARNH